MPLNRRRARAVHWLLPLLVLRLLLPTGVMPGVAHGAPALVLCSLQLDAPGVAAAAPLSDDEIHHADGTVAPDSAHDPAAQDHCPFGAAAHLAPILAPASIRCALSTVLTTVDAQTGRALAPPGPPRTQPSRAPPALS